MTKSEILQELLELLPTINNIFDNESAALEIDNEPILIVGDIHGNLEALNTIISRRNNEKILFLGDYIDRGMQGVEVLCTLFKLKIAEPNNIFLLRGNHEDKYMNTHYGFFDEIERNHYSLELLHQTFEKMPVAAIINNNIFCVHGGIPGACTINTITKRNSFQYIWNDPSNENGLNNSIRGDGIFKFGPDITAAFLKLNKFDMIIRAHTAISTGYAILFDGMLISIFSCPDYCDSNNVGAYVKYEHNTINITILSTKVN